jgi:hypothetical protein
MGANESRAAGDEDLDIGHAGGPSLRSWSPTLILNAARIRAHWRAGTYRARRRAGPILWVGRWWRLRRVAGLIAEPTANEVVSAMFGGNRTSDLRCDLENLGAGPPPIVQVHYSFGVAAHRLRCAFEQFAHEAHH